jgi:hypothetical protein
MDRFVSLQWTEAQKRDFSNYQEGQILLVHRSGRGMERHEALTVSRAAPETLIAHNERGEERTFTPVPRVPSPSMSGNPLRYPRRPAYAYGQSPRCRFSRHEWRVGDGARY